MANIKTQSNGVAPVAAISRGVPRSAKTERVSAKYIKSEVRNVGQMVDRIRTDEDFAFAFGVITATCKTIQISIDGDLPENREAIRDSLLQAWHRSLPSMLESLEYGRQAFEVLFRFDLASLSYLLDRLIPLDYDLSKMRIVDGQYCGVTFGKADDVQLSSEESWWLAINATSTKPYGRSIYLGAPWKVWKQRYEHERRVDVWQKRFSIGRSVTKVPSEYPGDKSGKGRLGEVNQSGLMRDPIADTEAVLQSTEAGGDLIFPSGNNKDGSSMYEHFPGQDLKDGDAQFRHSQYLDVKVLRSLKIPEKSVIQNGETGSRAMADAHQKVFNDVVEAYVSQIVESFQLNIVRRALRINRLPEDALVVNYKSIGDASDARAEQIVMNVIQDIGVSPLISTGLIDVVSMLEQVGVPLGADVAGSLAKLNQIAMATTQIGGTSPSPFPMSLQEAFSRRSKMIRELANAS